MPCELRPPARTRIRFLPTLSRRSSSKSRAPSPADTRAITALMPMTMPRLASTDRPLLTIRAVRATRIAARKLMGVGEGSGDDGRVMRLGGAVAGEHRRLDLGPVLGAR